MLLAALLCCTLLVAVSSFAGSRAGRVLSTPLSAVQRVGSVDEFYDLMGAQTMADERDRPTVLCVTREGCPSSPKMAAEFERSVEKIGDVHAFSLHLAADDTEAATSASELKVTRTPAFVCFERGQRFLDFIATTPGALFYGMQDAGLVLDARRDRDDGGGGMF